jgi:hypothetical protein
MKDDHEWKFQWLQRCTSIRQTALSLKVICPFEDIDVVIRKERLIAEELDRKLQEYTYFFDNNLDANGLEEGGNKEKEESRSCSKMDLEKMQTKLLDETWNLYVQNLFLDRTKMSLSAQVALRQCSSVDPSYQDGDNPCRLWAKEALPVRDALADNVTKLENESQQLQKELAQAIQQCRDIQSKNRAIWNQLHCHRRDGEQALTDSNLEQKQLRKQNRVLSCILADIIVGTDLLQSHSDQVSTIFLKENK